MDINDLRAAITLLAFIAFLGIVFWAYHRKSRRGFDEAAQLPFADDTQPADPSGRSRNT
jgi:cytochrome c oxidase cbb3-type subunit 4